MYNTTHKLTHVITFFGQTKMNGLEKKTALNRLYDFVGYIAIQLEPLCSLI